MKEYSEKKLDEGKASMNKADTQLSINKKDYAAKIIAERNQITSLVYFFFFLAVVLATPFFPNLPSTVKYFGGLIFVISLTSFFFSRLKNQYQKEHPLVVRKALYFLIIALAAGWSALCVYIMMQYSLSWASFFVFMVTLTLTSIHLSTLQPNFLLLVLLQSALLLPIPVYSFFFIGKLAGFIIGYFFLGVYILSLFVGWMQFIQFWKSENDRSLLQAIIDTLPGSIVRLNRQGSYIGVNRRFADLFDQPAEEFTGQKMGFAGFDGGLSELFSELLEQKKDRTSRIIDFGRKKLFFIGQKYNFGKEFVFLGIDMTDQFLVQDQLEFQRQQTMVAARYASLGEVLALILQSDLNEIKSNWGVLQKISSFDNPQKAGCDLGEVVHEVENLLAPILKKRSVGFQIEGFEKPIACACDRSELQLVLLNLLENSLQAISQREQKWIKITQQEEKGSISIKIVDSGEGIEEYLQEVIFEPSYSTKGAQHSTGVGLSVSRAIVQARGGELTYDGGAANTAFVIRLPRSSLD